MDLIVYEEELLVAVKSRVGKPIGTSMEVFCLHWVAMPMSTEQFWACAAPVYHNKGGDLMTTIIGGDLKDIVNCCVFEVNTPTGSRVNIWLGADWCGSPSDQHGPIHLIWSGIWSRACIVSGHAGSHSGLCW